MGVVDYYIHRFISKLKKDSNEYMNNYFRKCGCQIGEDTHIFSNIITSESFLIEIGNNTTIATDVKLLTHDASPGVVFGRDVTTDICGHIRIGDNCFVGSSSVILCGVTIPNDTIVAAGSVVVKSPDKEGMVIGGNPARIISSIEKYKEKNKDYFLALHGLDSAKRKETILSGKTIER